MAFHYLLLTALALFALQSFVLNRIGLRGISYERQLTKRQCFEGDELSLVETLVNRKPFPVPWLRVESQLSSELRFQSQTNLAVSAGSIYQNHKSFFSLMPYTKITRTHNITCTKRGVYRLESVSLSAGDLFGFARRTMRLSVPAQLMVYPRPLAYEELALPSHSWQGDLAVRRWIVEDPFLITGAREYRYGDSLKGVNWNATARSGKLQVHQRGYTADHRLLIVLNVETHEGMWNTVIDTELIEHGIRMAAGIAAYAIGQGVEAGFAANASLTDQPGQPALVSRGAGQPHLTYLYETMAKLVIAREIPIHELLERIRIETEEALDILIISAYESQKLHDALSLLTQSGHAVSIHRLEMNQDDVIAVSSKAGESA